MTISFDTLPKIKGLDPKLVPPRGAKAVGIHEMPGEADRIIYEQRVFDPDATKAGKKQATDAEGNPIWRKHQTTGENLVAVMTMEPQFRNRRFILVPFPNGKVKAVENFEETPEERREAELRTKREHWMDDFRDEAVRQGLSPQELVRQFIAGMAGEGEEIEVTEAEVDAVLDEDEGVLSASLPFDPGAYSVAELRKLDLTGLTLEQKALVREAEMAGQNRSTVLAALE